MYHLIPLELKKKHSKTIIFEKFLSKKNSKENCDDDELKQD